MFGSRRFRSLSAAMLSMLLVMATLAGCVSTSVNRVRSVQAKTATQEIPNLQLMNVNIAVFDPGIPNNREDADQPALYPAVRKAEARYMAVNLRRTLQRTGYWGAVRVVPEPIGYSELLITGEILYSNGLTLELKIHAEDAIGRVWLDKVYSAEAAGLAYQAGSRERDPFQDLYNRIANDLLAQRRELTTTQLREIRRVSKMRFATFMAPQTFGRYLAENGDHYELTGLPAPNNPAMARIERIRERDYALIDALDKYYRNYYLEIDNAYDQWRAASYREAENLREVRESALTRMLLGGAAVLAGIIGIAQAESAAVGAASQVAILGGVAIFGSGMQKYQESEIHAQALKELGRSLAADVEPHTVQLANQTVTLSGSAEAQYRAWRELLRKIRAAETGFGPLPEDAAPNREGDY